MKPRTYFGLALLFPYILWGICALVVFLPSSQEISVTRNIILMPLTFYVFGIIFWFIPYTLLAVGIWFWSMNKSTAALRKLALFSPILLSVFLHIEMLLVSLPANSIAEFSQELLSQSMLLGGFSLVFGYLCVGFALGVFKALQVKNLIVDETIPLLERVSQSATT